MTQEISFLRCVMAIVGLTTLRPYSRKLPAAYLPSWKRRQNDRAPAILDFPVQRAGRLVGRGRPPAPADLAPVHVAVDAAGWDGDAAPIPSHPDSSNLEEFLL